ncbi:hypothetical protein Daus18300_005409 [Diaporthe australafricana]|uniref:Uncharacterized protein n=1 Tax=Diaporthe australafricana TaxID=127596 RepID=A0ABR3X243_9PEZI
MDGETTSPDQQQIILHQNTEHQIAEHQITADTNATTKTYNPTVDTDSLVHLYHCSKLSFLIKMALLKNIKALGYALREEDVNQAEKSMEDARTQALEKWEQIRDRGFLYDADGSEYLRSSKLL